LVKAPLSLTKREEKYPQGAQQYEMMPHCAQTPRAASPVSFVEQ
jgi:hypothetical protein